MERRSGVRELSYWTILSPGLLGMGPWPLAFGAVPVQLAQVVRGAGQQPFVLARGQAAPGHHGQFLAGLELSEHRFHGAGVALAVTACRIAHQLLAHRRGRPTTGRVNPPSSPPRSTRAWTCGTSRLLPGTPILARRCVTTGPERILTVAPTTSWPLTEPLAPDRSGVWRGTSRGDVRHCRIERVAGVQAYALPSMSGPASHQPFTSSGIGSGSGARTGRLAAAPARSRRGL